MSSNKYATYCPLCGNVLVEAGLGLWCCSVCDEQFISSKSADGKMYGLTWMDK